MVALATAFIRLAPSPDRTAFVVAGRAMGDQAGAAAGKSMGSRILTEARTGLRSGGADLAKDGETIGANVGRGMSRGIGTNTRKATSDSSAFGNALALTAARATLFGTSAAAALPSIIHLTAALAPAAGAVTVLPAAFLAGKVAMGTFKVAIAGVSDAIKSGLTGTAAQAKKALDALPPSARAFAQSVIALKPQIDALRASVAQRFFAPLADEVGPLARTLFPLLRTQMAGVAGALGGLGEEIAQSARSAETFGAVRAIFTSTRLSLNNLRDAVFPVTAAMSSLITATAPFLPGLASGFASLAQRVAVFVDTAAQSGRISAAFQAAMTTLRDLGGIALNVGSILGSVFRAAAVGSGSLLGNLRALTGQVATFLRSAQGSAALTTVFSTLATLGNALRTSLAAVLPAIARSLAIIGPVLAGLAGPAAQLVVALAPLLPYFTSLTAIVLRTLTPAIAALAGWMTQHATTVRVLGTAIAGLVIGMRLLAVAERAQIAIAGLAKSVTLAWAIANGTAGTAAAGASIGVRLLGAAIRFMMGPIGIVITVIGLLAAAFVYLFNHNKTFHDAVIATWNGIKVAVGAVGAWFTGTLFPSIRTAIAQGAAAWGVLRGAVMAAWNGVRAAVTTVGAAISAVMRGIGAVVTWLAQNIFGPYFRVIGAVVHAAWVVIQVAAAAIRYEFTFIGRVAQALYATYILPVFRAIGATVRALYTATVQPVVNLIRAAWTAMGNLIRAVWNSVILPVFRVFVGTAVSTGNTLRGWFERIRGWFSALGSGIRAVWTGTILPVFNALIDGVRNRVAGAFRTGVAAITAAWNRVKEAARVPVAFVVNRVINPFIGGINRAASFFGVKDRISPIGGFARGGMPGDGRIPGPASATDNRLAMLYDSAGRIMGNIKVATGEFIVNADATRKALPILQWINNGMRGEPRLDAIPPGTPYRRGGEIPGYQLGGLVDWAKGLIGKGAKAVANVFKTVSDPAGTLRAIANRAISAIPGGAGIRGIVVGAARKLVNAAISWLSGLGGTGGAAGIVGNASPGFPPWPSSPSAQRGDSGVWRSIVALIRSTGPVSGSFGNAYRPGDPLWHGSGRAVDWMGFNQDALATFLANRRPLELIHRTNRRDYAYTRGRNMGSFNAGLMQAHRNHVHIAMAGGGLLPAAGLPLKLFDTGGTWPSGTLGANLSGKTEYVSTGRGDADLVDVLTAILDAVRDNPDRIASALERPTRRAVQLGRTRGTATMGWAG